MIYGAIRVEGRNISHPVIEPVIVSRIDGERSTHVVKMPPPMFKMRNPIWLTALIKREEGSRYVGEKEKSKKSNLESMDDRRGGGFPITIPNWIHYVITRVVTSLVWLDTSAGIESIISSPETRLDWLQLPMLREKRIRGRFEIGNKLAIIIDRYFSIWIFHP